MIHTHRKLLIWWLNVLPPSPLQLAVGGITPFANPPFHHPLLLLHSPAPQLAGSLEKEICCMTNKSGPILLFPGVSCSHLRNHHNFCNSCALAKTSVKLE